jgi:intracellular sulfur oxidation DsrE/DsrF family protein
MANDFSAPVRRRSFLSRAGVAAAAVGLGGVVTYAQGAGGGRFQPARHTQDDWLDAVPGKHRLYLDALTGAGAGDALLFAGNFLNNSKAAYNLADADSAVVICFRHFATPFAWTDAIWAKYGEPFTQMLTKINDPKTGKAPTINLYKVSGYGMQLNNLGTTIDDLVKRGVQFAVCDTATKFTAAQLAQATKGETDAIYKDLTSNTIPNSRYVSAGIVATNRAQERGYTLAHCG